MDKYVNICNVSKSVTEVRHMDIYINICNVSKTPVGSQGCFQKMVIIKSNFKSITEHTLGKVMSINEGRKSVCRYFMILNAVYLHLFLFFIHILRKAKLQGLFSLRFDQTQNPFHTIVKHLNQFEEITYLLTEFNRRGKYDVPSLP